MVDIRKEEHTLDSFVKFLPTEGWLAKYLLYTSGGEIPPRFNFFCGLFTLASIIRRKVYFEKDDKVFPALYIILISPPAVGKKSRAIAFSEKILNIMKKDKPRILPSKITAEELLSILALKQEFIVGDKVTVSSSGILLCTELVNLIGRQQYLTGLVHLLTELFDCPDEKTVGTIKHGEWKLKNVFISLVGGITPTGLQKDVPSEVLETGFLSRVLLVRCPDGWKVRIPRPEKRDARLQLSLATDLEEYAKMEGEMHFTPETEKLYDKWYVERESPSDYGYYEREPDHVIKMAMLLELSQTRSFTIQKNTLLHAIHISEFLGKESIEFIPRLRAEQASVRTEFIYKKLLELGGKDVPHSLILQKCWHTLPGRGGEFNEIIEELCQMNKIVREITPKGNLYTCRHLSLWRED